MRPTLILFFSIVLICCQQSEKASKNLQEVKHEEDNGKRVFDKSLKNPLQADSILGFNLSLQKNSFKSALQSQKEIIRRAKYIKSTKNVGSRLFGKPELQKTYDILSEYETLNDSLLFAHFEYYQLQGEDSIGNVHFTGYFTPTIEVRTKPDSVFQYPFYKYPRKWRGKLPTRKQIDSDKVLAKKGLEIAWSNDLFQNFILQVQGSGIVQFEDGIKKILAYEGKNGYDYKSIGRYFVNNGIIPEEEISVTAIGNWFSQNPGRMTEILNLNESYIFFKLLDPIPKGAAGVSLIPEYSSAIDTNFIPMGSALLAEVPQLDSLGNFVSHEYKILFAMDRGGAIKGPGRLDIYFGIGDDGFRFANHMNHYGRVWLMVPR